MLEYYAAVVAAERSEASTKLLLGVVLMFVMLNITYVFIDACRCADWIGAESSRALTAGAQAMDIFGSLTTHVLGFLPTDE